MVTAILAAALCLPLSLILIVGFFNQKVYAAGSLFSRRNFEFIGFHSVLLASSIGSVFILIGYPFDLVQGLLLALVIAATDFAIVWALT